MTIEQLGAFKHELPFKPFTIHMTDGSKLKVDDPESLVMPKNWKTDAIVTFPNGTFSFVYLRNIARVGGSGGLPNLNPRRRGKAPDGDDDS